MVHVMKLHYQKVKTKTSVLTYFGIAISEHIQNRNMYITDLRVNTETYDYDYIIDKIKYACKLYEVDYICFVKSTKHGKILKEYYDLIKNDARISTKVLEMAAHHQKIV